MEGVYFLWEEAYFSVGGSMFFCGRQYIFFVGLGNFFGIGHMFFGRRIFSVGGSIFLWERHVFLRSGIFFVGSGISNLL